MERYLHSLETHHKIIEAISQMKDSSLKQIARSPRFTSAVLPDASPFGLNFAMFIPTLEKQASPEQKEKWLKKARELKIVGTYAQTELGHGTFLR